MKAMMNRIHKLDDDDEDVPADDEEQADEAGKIDLHSWFMML